MRMNGRSYNVLKGLLFLALVGICYGCTPPKQPVVVEYYKPAFRQLPPEPVYSRLQWGHPPQPIRPKARNSAPLFNPVISFELSDSNFGEAVEALAQTIGYTWHYPPRVAKRPVAVKMAATPEEILHELCAQADVEAVLDHNSRSVRVVDESMIPKLPGS